MEDNNKIGKTRYLLMKIGDIKGTFHVNMDMIKNKSVMDLTEAEEIKKRQQECTLELFKKFLNDPDNHDDVVTHLETDMPEYKVKWALENVARNRATGGDGIPAELLKILKDDAVKVLHTIYKQIWKIHQWPQDWKICFYSNPKLGQCQECSNFHAVVLISRTSRFILKIFQPRLQQYMNLELPDVQAGF